MQQGMCGATTGSNSYKQQLVNSSL